MGPLAMQKVVGSNPISRFASNPLHQRQDISGELDKLVLGYLRKHKEGGPLTASAVAKGLERSSGAVANCLERMAKA
jgi:hypothetical protein